VKVASEVAYSFDVKPAGVFCWVMHVIGSTGEPWDPDSYEWLAQDVFGGRVPVINFSGGTEVGGSFLAPYPVEPIRSCSLGGPSLGMDVDVVDDQARPVRGEVGELVCRRPWPAMTRGVWKDEDRYLEAYLSTFPGIWRHGDFAMKKVVAAELGKPFTPSVVHRVSRLPKTRSAKILRRAVRAAALGIDPGDLSGAENPEALGEIRAAVAPER
jgi:acyl-coenzyme A synthetase/AMP-(fatty) acid ligase